ncbi:MAG: flagellar basal body protein, partial [Peptococcaceae bacterium]|nr:flagellar basal body protein [Peptococcaceae bacterium]
MFGPGTFFGLEIGRRALQAETRSLNVVSHNLANMNTEGYTRQYAVHEASYPWCYPIYNQKITYGQLGTGVDISH